MPLTFSLKSGGEEIRAAPLVYIPELKRKSYSCWNQTTSKHSIILINWQAYLITFCLFSLNLLTWHDGDLPNDEVWIKIGGDKGGSSFKMNLQIVNVSCPIIYSIANTCIFTAFQAPDTVTNLHVALDSLS